MVFNDIEKTVAKLLGISLAQNKADIGKAIAGVLEEVSNVVDVSEAQKLHTVTIASEENEIDRPEKNDRILSVQYSYDSNGRTINRILTPLKISDFDMLQSGQQNLQTDFLRFYAVSGLKILIGKGVADTGGSILVRTQRALRTKDIQYIPNPMMIVYGAISNYVPMKDPKTGLPNVTHDKARARFVRAMAPTGLGLQDVKEKHSEISLPDNVLEDDAFRNYLGRGTNAGGWYSRW